MAKSSWDLSSVWDRPLWSLCSHTVCKLEATLLSAIHQLCQTGRPSIKWERHFSAIDLRCTRLLHISPLCRPSEYCTSTKFDIVPPLNFKTPLSAYTVLQNAKMSNQCVIVHLPHSSASNFQSKKTQAAWEEAHWRGTHISSLPRVRLLSQDHCQEVNGFPSLFNSQSHSTTALQLFLTPISSLACQRVQTFSYSR